MSDIIDNIGHSCYEPVAQELTCKEETMLQKSVLFLYTLLLMNCAAPKMPLIQRPPQLGVTVKTLEPATWPATEYSYPVEMERIGLMLILHDTDWKVESEDLILPDGTRGAYMLKNERLNAKLLVVSLGPIKLSTLRAGMDFCDQAQDNGLQPIEFMSGDYAQCTFNVPRPDGRKTRHTNYFMLVQRKGSAKKTMVMVAAAAPLKNFPALKDDLNKIIATIRELPKPEK